MTTILRLLPQRWARLDLARRLALAVADPLERWRALIGQLPEYLTPTGAPVSWLDWLLALQGYPPLPDLAEARKRALLAGGLERWARKGTPSAIEDYVRALAGVEAEVVNDVGPAFIAGIGRAGDVCGPGARAWRFTIRVPAGSITEAELRALLGPVVPAFLVWTFEEI